MFSKKSMHISLAFVLLIALATLGLAYGFWTETLSINGTVGTGTLDVAFADPGLPITEYDPGNAGTCVFVFDPSGNSIQVTLTGVYPWYECNKQVNMVNNGTVPVTFSGPFSVSKPAWIEFGVGSIGVSPIGPGGSVQLPLMIFVTEAAPEGASGATFYLEFNAEQVH